MTRKAHGSLWSRLWRKATPRQRRWTIALIIVLASILVFETGRRLLLTSSLYSLNLRAHAPLGEMPQPLFGQKIVIFAPHPDDETLGNGGYIRQAVTAGARVHVVLMTNGEYPELSVVLFEESLPIRPRAFIRLGYRRQSETLAAMRSLGIPETAVTFFGYPNQYLNQLWLPGHWPPSHPVRSARTRTTRSPYDNAFTPRTVYCGQAVLRDVEAMLLREQPDIVITLHPHDVHVDHWPTYTFVRFAVNELAAQGHAFAQRCRVYTYLIHRDQWPAPRGYFPALPLDPPAGLVGDPQTTWLARPLTVAETIDTHKATALYRTQGGSFDPLLRSFARANELYGVLPAYSWPLTADVASRVVITDPAADLDNSAMYPQGDILRVTLARAGRRGVVRITTRGYASPKLHFHFSLHAGSGQPAERVMAEYDWNGGTASGLVYARGRLHRLRGSAFRQQFAAHTTVLSFPWPTTDAQTFFLVRAWTTRGVRVVDQTLTNSLSVRPVLGMQ